MKLIAAFFILHSLFSLQAAALQSPRGAELFAVTPRRARPPGFVARYLPLPMRLLWSHEEMGNGRVSFVVESSTNQVDWIERARLAAHPATRKTAVASLLFRQ